MQDKVQKQQDAINWAKREHAKLVAIDKENDKPDPKRTAKIGTLAQAHNPKIAAKAMEAIVTLYKKNK